MHVPSETPRFHNARSAHRRGARCSRVSPFRIGFAPQFQCKQYHDIDSTGIKHYLAGTQIERLAREGVRATKTLGSPL